MNGLPENQKRILDFLLTQTNGASLDEFVVLLGITKTAVKEHVSKLQSYGYLFYEDEKGSIGRPKRRYKLSPAGQEVFPRQYSWLSNVLLELLSEKLGAEAISRLMKDLAIKVGATMQERFKRAGTPRDILVDITEALNELGYRASLKQSDLRKGAVVEATNCVYHSVARRHPELCQFDVQLLKEASGLEVKLEKCISRGDAVCRFCLNRKSPST